MTLRLVWDSERGEIVQDESEDFDGPLPNGIPHPEEFDDEGAQLSRSISVKWFRSSASPDAFHSFRVTFPAGISKAAYQRIGAALKAAHWRSDDAPYWRPGSGSGGGAYWYDGSDHDEFLQLDELLRAEIEDVFHIGDAPLALAGHLHLRWHERTAQDYVRCTIHNIDRVSPARMQQLGWIVESLNGFKEGQIITFPQIASGDIVTNLQMAGFSVSETFSDDEPHYEQISENAGIWVKGWIGQEPWIFQTRGDFWEVRIGGADPALWPKWSCGDRYGDTSFSAAAMPFSEAELLIAAAIQRYRNGHPEQPLKGA